jgi:hypothetical protein
MDLGDFNPVRVLAGKGEIGKTGIGPALATLALDYFVPGLGEAAGLGMSNAATAATLVGGGTALASGSLQKGLMAGISAYGTESLLGGAEKGIADAAAQRATPLDSFVNQTAATPASLPTGEAFKAGLSGLKAMPTMDLLKYGAMAAAPVLMAQSQKGMPSNTTNPGAYIRPKTYDPVSHRYYDLPAVKAGDWGNQSISDYVNSQVAPARAARGGLMAAYANGGMAQDAAGGGMFNYAQMQPAVNLNPNSGVTPQNMAKGGIAHFADTGAVASSETPAAVTAAIQAGLQGFAPGTTAQDVVNNFGLTQAQANQVAKAIGYTGDTVGLNYGISAVPTATAAPSAGWNMLQGTENALYPTGETPGIVPVYTNYSPTQMGDFFTSHPDAVIPDAIRQYNASPNAVNQYIAGVAKNYVDPTATQKGSGTLGIYQDLMKQGFSPTEFSTAEKGTNSKFGATGDYWNQDTVAKAYQVADKVLQFDPLTDKVTPSDKEWVAFMDKNNISTKDISIATGLSQNEVNNRYNAVKASVPTTTPTPTPTTTGTTTSFNGIPIGLPTNATAPVPGTSNVTQTALPTNSGTNAPAGTVNPYGNVNNPGDVTFNADNSKTVQSNEPGKPYAGWSGVGEVTNAFTAGGGHLGQVLKPKKTYTNTGASGSAYDYLNGVGKWADTNPQPAAKVKNTYSNFSAPTADEKAQFAKYAKVYKDGIPVDNPYYNKGNIIDSNGPVANLINQVSNDAGGGLAGGGLSALARGGMSDGHLGGYSDGGHLLRGPGDGVSDSIPATIAGKQPARLADGEFVVPARIVSEIGNGSTEAGARKLYAMMDRVQSARSKTVGKGKIAKNTRADKYLPA